MKCYKHPENTAVGMCTSCGKAVCDSCQIEVSNKLICKSCAEEKLEKNQSFNTNSNFNPNINNNFNLSYSDPNNKMYPNAHFGEKKNKDLAAILAVFGGWFGLHKFYLNKPGQGIAMVLFSPTGIPFVISLAEAFMMFSSSPEEFDRKFNPNLFTYKSLPENTNNPNIITPNIFESNITPNNSFDDRKRFSKKSIIDIDSDFVDSKKELNNDKESDDSKKE